MENKVFLEQMKLYYDSLKYFSIEDSFLVLKLNTIFKIPLRHINLSTLDQNIFLLSPAEIFQLIYVSELLYKEKLIDSEIEFITNTRQQESLIYTKKALEQALEATKMQEIQDLISIDIKTALMHLSEISGESITDEVLNNIFDNFCIGK